MILNAELNVDGMTCEHCKAKVEQKLKALRGVNKIEVDVPADKVTVSYDDGKVNLVKIKQEIMEEGYAVVEV